MSNGGNPRIGPPATQAPPPLRGSRSRGRTRETAADRTRLATVDIRQGSTGAESWSNTQERDDRTRSGGRGRRRRSTVSQVRIAAAAAFVVLGFVVAAQVAKADTPINGTPAAQQAASRGRRRTTLRRATAASADGSTATTGGATSGDDRHGRSRLLDQHRFGPPLAAIPVSQTVTPDGHERDVDHGDVQGHARRREGASPTPSRTAPHSGAARRRNDREEPTTAETTDQAIDPGDRPELEHADRGGRCGVAQRNSGNSNVSVRVDQPGNTGAVSQANEAHRDRSGDVRRATGVRARQVPPTPGLGHCATRADRGEQHHVNVRVEQPRRHRERHAEQRRLRRSAGGGSTGGTTEGRRRHVGPRHHRSG